MKSDDDFEVPNFVEIHLGKLEEAWLEHPVLYQKYATMLAESKLKLAEARTQLDITEAEIKNGIRQNPKAHGIEKITEGVVSEKLTLSEEYIKKVKRVTKAKYRVDVLEAIINTLEHRKRTLENLVTLHGQNYFSKPKVSPDAESGLAKASRPKPLKG